MLESQQFTLTTTHHAQFKLIVPHRLALTSFTTVQNYYRFSARLHSLPSVLLRLIVKTSSATLVLVTSTVHVVLEISTATPVLSTAAVRLVLLLLSATLSTFRRPGEAQLKDKRILTSCWIWQVRVINHCQSFNTI